MYPYKECRIYNQFYTKKQELPMAEASLDLFYLFRKGNPLVGQGHIKIIQNVGYAISIVFSELNSPRKEKVMTIKVKLKNLILLVKVI